MSLNLRRPPPEGGRIGENRHEQPGAAQGGSISPSKEQEFEAEGRGRVAEIEPSASEAALEAVPQGRSESTPYPANRDAHAPLTEIESAN